MFSGHAYDDAEGWGFFFSGLILWGIGAYLHFGGHVNLAAEANGLRLFSPVFMTALMLLYTPFARRVRYEDDLEALPMAIMMFVVALSVASTAVAEASVRLTTFVVETCLSIFLWFMLQHCVHRWVVVDMIAETHRAQRQQAIYERIARS